MSRSRLVMLAASLLVGCQGVQVRPHGADPSRGGAATLGSEPRVGPVDPAAPGETGAGGGRAGPIDPRTSAAGHTSGEQRRVCRSASRPRGWIAVAYVAGNGDCPLRGGRDTVYTVAVITHYANLPVGSRLDVCADEHVPIDWVRDDLESDNVADSCPGATANGGSATRRIRRAR